MPCRKRRFADMVAYAPTNDVGAVMRHWSPARSVSATSCSPCYRRDNFAATYHAAMALDADGQHADRAVSVAKAYVSDAINHVAGEALQLHGGIGFTWEHDLHLYLRRARTDALLAGDTRFHKERLCHLLESAQA